MLFQLSLLFISCIVVLGYFLCSGLRTFCPVPSGNDPSPCFVFEDIPTYFVTALAFLAAAGTVLSLCGFRLVLSQFVFILAAAAGAGICRSGPGLFRWRSETSAMFKAGGVSQIHRTLFWSGFIFIAFILSLKMFLRMAYAWYEIDLINQCLFRAKILMFEGLLHSPYFQDSTLSTIYNTYPPLVPVIYAWFFRFLGGTETAYFHVLNYFALGCAGFEIFNILSKKLPVWKALAWFFIFISSLSYVQKVFIMDNSDITLSLFFLTTAARLVKYSDSRSEYDLAVCSILASGAALTKNEGMVFAIMVFLILSWDLRRQRHDALSMKLRPWFKNLVLPFGVFIGPWWFYKTVFLKRTEVLLPENKILEILPYFFQNIRGYAKVLFSLDWNGVFLLLLVLAFARARTLARGEKYFFGLILFMLGVYFSVIYIGQGNDIPLGIFSVNAIRRTTAHVYPMAVAMVGMML